MLMGLFLTFNRSGTTDEIKAKLEAYWTALDELTADEVVAACRKAMRGEIGNPAFMPTGAELYQAARPTARRANKRSPDWRPHQNRFLSSSGSLYVTEGGFTEIYSPQELREVGYAIPKPVEVLNRQQLTERGSDSIHRLTGPKNESEISDTKTRRLIESGIKKIPEEV